MRHECSHYTQTRLTERNGQTDLPTPRNVISIATIFLLVIFSSTEYFSAAWKEVKIYRAF